MVLVHRAEEVDFTIRDYPSLSYMWLNFEKFSALRRVAVCFLGLFLSFFLSLYEGKSKSKGKIHLTALIEVTVSNFTYDFST